MDIVGFLSSLNKIGLIAFLITLGFLIYEIYLLRKASQAPQKPSIPQFVENATPLTSAQPIVMPESQPLVKSAKNNIYILAFLLILLVVFAAITLLGYLNLKATSFIVSKSNISPTKEPFPTEKPSPTPTFIEPTLPSTTPTPTEMPLTVASPTILQTAVPTSSPTVINKLPETGDVNSSLILFSIAGLVLFFSFLF